MNRSIVEIRTKPYGLTPSEKAEMRTLFDDVMCTLDFFARPPFLERLFGTDILLMVRAPSGELVSFGFAVYRVISGHRIIHIIAMYVSPKWRRKSIMRDAITRLLLRELLRSPRTLLHGLIVTGSAVNPQVVYALARKFQVWPDLLESKAPPQWVLDVAQKSSEQYYPVQTGIPFQVQITDEFAGFREGRNGQRSESLAFNERFFQYAKPNELKLLFFVAELRVSALLRLAATSLFRRKSVAPG